MAPRNVCCRAGKPLAPPVSSGGRRSKRVSMAWGVSDRMRAAASPIANGRPSGRPQISATAGAFLLVIENAGRTPFSEPSNRAPSEDAPRSAPHAHEPCLHES